MSKRVFKLHSSAIFSIDEQATFAEEDKLEFISLALQAECQFDDSYEGSAGEVLLIYIYSSSGYLFIRVLHRHKFADSFSPDYFLKTFSSYFSYSRGKL